MSHQGVTLKVLEAYTRDVGRGIVRLDYDAMDSLDASTGDVVELKGKKRTVGKCLPLYPSDEGKGLVRIDGLTRDSGRYRRSHYRKKNQSGTGESNRTPLESIPHRREVSCRCVGKCPGDQGGQYHDSLFWRKVDLQVQGTLRWQTQ